MAELGALPDVAEKCLKHTEVGKVKRIHQRAQYEGPMREAWKLLGKPSGTTARKGRWQHYQCRGYAWTKRYPDQLNPARNLLVLNMLRQIGNTEHWISSMNDAVTV